MILIFQQKVKVLNEETGEEETHVIQPEVRGVTFKEVYDFFEFMKNIHDVDTAFAFYAMSGKVMRHQLCSKLKTSIS